MKLMNRIRRMPAEFVVEAPLWIPIATPKMMRLESKKRFRLFK
jgi:hypothetical protein